MRAKHRQQSLEGRGGAFLGKQKRRVDLARRIVHRHDQVHRVEPGKPLMPRAVLMQHHARQRTAWPLATMRPTLGRMLQ